MAAAPYILARSMKEAHAFAREELGLVHGRYRIVNTASTLKSVRGVDLYLVPGWQNRFDRFGMKGAIRWTRMNVIDVALQAEALAADRWEDTAYTRTIAERYNQLRNLDAPDGLEPAGVQLTLVTSEDAHSFLTTGRDDTISEGGPAVDQGEDSDSGVKRRRRRCNDCGTLHFKDDPCVKTEPFEGV